MGATYTRQSSFTDGDVITADLFNNEYDQLLAAFAASTGHTHDGTAAEGGPITKLLGTSITIGDATSGTDITVTFDGETNDGVFKWMEDEDYFEFSDDLLIASTEKIQFRDTAIYINSSTDGQLDIVADSEIQIAATTIDINGNVDISGTLTIGGAGISEAELEILDGATVTTTEINILDGDTTASSTTVADADRVVFNDAGTMKQVAVTDLAAYFDDEITAMPNLVTTAATTVGALNSGSITSGFGTIDTGSSTITTTGLISGGSLDIDDVLINGTTIGHTDDTDLITLANGVVTIAGEVSMTTLDIGGTNVTSTAAELNILDGVTSTAAELNILDGVTSTAAELNILDGVTSTAAELNILDGVTSTAAELNILDGVTSTAAELNLLDGVSGLVQADFTKLAAVDSTAAELNIVDGDTSATATTVADADRVVMNDNGTMVQVAVTDLAAYFDDEITAMPNLVTTAATTVGALNSGSITSGFGTIDTGSSAITTTGVGSFGSLDISGDIDVDGTTNLDVVDIDGAVNMATTALVTGVLTTTAATVFNGGFAANATSTITTADNLSGLIVASTDADANAGPTIQLKRDSSSPADNDLAGNIIFVAENDASEATVYANLGAHLQDVTNGTEDGKFFINTIVAGAEKSRMFMPSTETVFNEESIDLDFRVESNGNANMLFVDGGFDGVGIGVAPMDEQDGFTTLRIAGPLSLNVDSAGAGAGVYMGNNVYRDETNDRWEYVLGDEASQYYQANGTHVWRYAAAGSANAAITWTEAMRIDSSGRVGIGTASPQTGIHLEAADGTVNGTIRLTATSVASAGMAVDANGLNFGADTGGFVFKTGATANDPSDTGTERMRIDSSGNLAVGNTTVIGRITSNTAGGTAYGAKINASGSGMEITSNGLSNSMTALIFKTNHGTVGSITCSNTTAFNTSSDYRLKTDAKPMANASDRVLALKPVNFEWLSDGSRVDGFIAHEAQAIVPEAVTGTKDAMMDEEYQVSAAKGDIYTAGSDAGFTEISAAIGASPAYYDVDGNIIKAEVIAKAAVHEAYDAVAEIIHSADVEQPETLADGQQWRETTPAVMGTRSVPEMQGIDQSKIVPLLVASLQEALARITALENA